MNISAFSPASIWSAVTRTLTGMGGSIGFNSFGPTATLGANGQFDMRTGAGAVNCMTFAATADASGTVVFQFTDGTHTWVAATIAAGTTGGISPLISVTQVGVIVKNNSATVTINFWASGYTFIQ